LVCSALFTGVLAATQKEDASNVELDEEDTSYEGIFRSVLSWGAKQKVIDATQLQKLKAELDARLEKYNEKPGRFVRVFNAVTSRVSLLGVLYFGGALIVISGMTLFMTIGWESFGGGGIFFISFAYWAIFTAVATHFWNQPEFQLVGGLLHTVAVCMTPLAVYGLQKAFKIRVGDMLQTYSDFSHYVSGGWIYMELVTVVVASITLYYVRFPFLTAPIAFILFFMSMDVTPLLFGKHSWGWDERSKVSIVFGANMLLLAWWIDRQTVQDFSFWLYLFGGLAFTGGMLAHTPSKKASARMTFLALHVLMIYFSLVFQRGTLLFYGFVALCFFYGLSIIEIGRYKPRIFETYSIALNGVLLLAISYRGATAFQGGDVEYFLAIFTFIDFNFVAIKGFLNGNELMTLAHLGTNLGIVLCADYFEHDISLYFISFSGRFLLVFIGFIGVTANNISSLILEVEIRGNRTWYYVYRFIFALIQIALAIAFKTHLFVLTGLSSILFHVFLTVGYKYDNYRTNLRKLLPNTLYTWLALAISVMFQSRVGFFVALGFLGTIQGRLQRRGRYLVPVATVTLFLAIVLDSRLLVILGAGSLFLWLGYISSTIFKNSLLFPFVMMGIGSGVILAGIQYQKYQDVIRGGVMSLLLPPGYEDTQIPPDLSVYLPTGGGYIGERVRWYLSYSAWPAFMFKSITSQVEFLKVLPFYSTPLTLVPYILLVVILWNIGVEYLSKLLKEDEIDANLPPKISLKTFNISLPQDTDQHGLVLDFEGTKPADFTVNSVYIHIEGKEFWTALEAMFGAAVLTTVKLALYPLKIVVGKRMNPSAIVKGQTKVKGYIQLGTGKKGEQRLSHNTLRANLRRLINYGDPQFLIKVVYYGSGGSKGILFTTQLSASQMLNSLRTNYNIEDVFKNEWDTKAKKV
jgi:hypothetical protein